MLKHLISIVLALVGVINVFGYTEEEMKQITDKNLLPNEVRIDSITYQLDPTTHCAVLVGTSLNYCFVNGKLRRGIKNGSISGDFIVPSTINYNGEEYKVASIYSIAFLRCPQLRSITIPDSVYLDKGYYIKEDDIEHIDEDEHSCDDWFGSDKGFIISGSKNLKFINYKGIKDWDRPEKPTAINLKGYNFLIEGTAIDGLCYLFVNDNAIVVGTDKSKAIKKIKVPDAVKYNGKKYKVEQIAPYDAFRKDTIIESVKLPKHLYTCPSFQGCTHLKEIVFSNEIHEIGPEFLGNCYQLERIKLPDSLQYLPSCFTSTKSLKTIYIPHNIKLLDICCYNCKSLKEIIIDNSSKDVEIKGDPTRGGKVKVTFLRK